MKAKLKLGFYPTPIEYLKNLSSLTSSYLIYIKRDDQTGLATGGNKTRKLDFLIQDAIENNCDTIITSGAQQSNHCRQTAAAANKTGLNCHLILRGKEPDNVNGNLLLNKLLGANIYFVDELEMKGFERILAVELTAKGHKPYIIPIGGSNAIGARGYINAVEELLNQQEDLQVEFDYIFFASCSGGTHAGLVLGKYLHNLKSKVFGINIAKDPDINRGLGSQIKNIIQDYFLMNKVEPVNLDKEIILIEGYNDAGYGSITNNEKDAINLLAEKEGILLDPIYTARAFYAMMDMLSRGVIPPNSRVLFWHTGGIAANFAYSKEII